MRQIQSETDSGNKAAVRTKDVISIVGTDATSDVLTGVPSVVPVVMPSLVPKVMPSVIPIVVPSAVPKVVPSAVPVVVSSAVPKVMPSVVPIVMPVVIPTVVPVIMSGVMAWGVGEGKAEEMGQGFEDSRLRPKSSLAANVTVLYHFLMPRAPGNRAGETFVFSLSWESGCANCAVAPV